MTAILEKEETILWKGNTITMKGFAKMIPNMTITDIDNFLDNKKLVKQVSTYLKKHPGERIKKNA